MASKPRGRVVLRGVLFLGLIGLLWSNRSGDDAAETPLAPGSSQHRVAEPPPAFSPLTTFTRPAAPPPVAPAAIIVGEAEIALETAGENEAESEVREIDLDDLEDAVRLELTENAMAQIRELADACEDDATEPINAVAAVTVDAAGLLEMTLGTYGDSPDLSDGLAGCLEGVLWQQDWLGAPAGTELNFELTLRFEG